MTTETIEIDAQYRQLREDCGLLERPDRALLLVTGPDAAEYLHSQVSNEIEALEPGGGCYAVLLDRKGHLQADMRVLRTEAEALLLDTEAATAAGLLKHLRMYSIGREVEIADESDAWSLISLIGPRAAAVAGEIVLPENGVRRTSVGAVECLAVGAADGLDLLVAAESAAGLRDYLLGAGAAAVSEEAAEIVRIEAGRPRFGVDMDGAAMPAEAGIVERAISFTKGCYIGQEPVARLHYKGRPNRHLRGLELSAPLAGGEALHLGEKEVGRVGSVCVSPARGPLALAIVRREAEPGAELRAGEDGVTARVIDLPFG